MSNLTPGKPVVAVALNRPGGDVALRRAMAADLPVVALLERGVPSPPGVVETVELPVDQVRVGPAIREAAARETAWVVVPRTMGTADYLISAGLRSVGKHVDLEHPGIAMLVVSPQRDPEVPYRRALAMVDLAGRAASGVAALAAVELCIHSGAALDVLALGLEDGPRPVSTQEWAALLPVARRYELFRRALGLAVEHRLDITWMAGDNADPVGAVSAQAEQGDYDVVIDAASGHRLRKRIGTRHDMRRLVKDHARRRVAWSLLQDSTCDVLVVMDAISLGMMPATAVRSGAAAALALGMVSAATPVTAQASTPSVVQVSVAGQVTPEQVADARRRASRAESKVTRAQRALAEAEDRVLKERDEASEARNAVVQARQSAAPAAAELAAARRQMGEAEKERMRAVQELEAAEARLTASTRPTVDSAQRAADAAAATAARAVDTSRAARSAEAAAHEEYLVFAAEVEAAEAELLAAADDIARAKAHLREIADQAATASKKSRRLVSELRALDEALAMQGLHSPAVGAVTSGFGPRVHPVTGVYKLHTGTDFEGTDGRYYAMASGVVTYAGYDGAYGYMVKVDHGSIGGQRMETWYAHQPDLSVDVGQQVAWGEVIGRIGNTGYSTGPHAHVELHVNGQPVDLMEHL